MCPDRKYSVRESGIDYWFQNIPGESAQFDVLVANLGEWTQKKQIRTFLNSEAALRMVVDIGGGSVACTARAGLKQRQG